MVIFEMHKPDLGILPKVRKMNGSYRWQVNKPPLIGLLLYLN